MENTDHGGSADAAALPPGERESWFLIEIGEVETLFRSGPERDERCGEIPFSGQAPLGKARREPTPVDTRDPLAPGGEMRPRTIPRFDPIAGRRQELFLWTSSAVILLLALLSHFHLLPFASKETAPLERKSRSWHGLRNGSLARGDARSTLLPGRQCGSLSERRTAEALGWRPKSAGYCLTPCPLRRCR